MIFIIQILLILRKDNPNIQIQTVMKFADLIAFDLFITFITRGLIKVNDRQL